MNTPVQQKTEKQKRQECAAYLFLVAIIFMIFGLYLFNRTVEVSNATCYQVMNNTTNATIYANIILWNNDRLTCLLTEPLWPTCISKATLVENNNTNSFPICRARYAVYRGDAIVLFIFMCIALAISIFCCVLDISYYMIGNDGVEKTRDEIALEEARKHKPYVPNEDA